MVMLDIGMSRVTGYDAAMAMRMMPEMRQTIVAAITEWKAQEDRVRTREADLIIT